MIVQQLRSGRLTTARMLAETLEVSDRTVYRDIAHLMGAGLPIEGEAGLGYMMRSGYDLPPLMFSEEEIVALTAGARMVSAFGGRNMARGADSALQKINHVLPDAMRDRADHVAIHTIPAAAVDPATRAAIDALEQATQSTRRVQLAYRDEAGSSSDRTVRPLGLWFWGKVWTLVAWCELRADFRMFRIDRIITAEVLDAYAPLPGQTLKDFYTSEAGHHERDRLDKPDQITTRRP
jgi:predicted DNA-binding transcriptional regulator YafY